MKSLFQTKKEPITDLRFFSFFFFFFLFLTQARTRVHEYGGGASLVHNGTVYYSHFSDNALYSVSAPNTASAVRLTPLDKGWRFADARVSDKWYFTSSRPQQVRPSWHF